MLQFVREGYLSLDGTVEQWLPDVVQGNGNDGGRISVSSCCSTPAPSLMSGYPR
ncbi:hypothetical protein [Streptomyces sp. NPDC017993]|uniref:hypothetical protein n=1 Tax=Streptomyces sp. NPDC017993 TaxID=3365027 RepID=UPI0037970F1D